MTRTLPLRWCTALMVAVGSPLAGQSVPEWRLTRDLHIDATTADLTRVGALLVSPKGEILVTQPVDRTIRVFSGSGQSRSIGRSGEGPGEFRNVSVAGWLGDSLWVSDASVKRVSIFSPGFTFVRSFRFPTGVTGPPPNSEPTPPDTYLTPVALYPDGSVQLSIAFQSHRQLPSWAKGVDSAGTLVLRTSTDGVWKSRVAAFRPSPCMPQLPVGNSIILFQISFCFAHLSSIRGGDPTMVVVTPDGAQSTNTYRVVVTEGNGAQRLSRSYSYTPISVSRVARDSADAKLQKAFATNPAALAVAKGLPQLSTWPGVKRVILGRDGSIWLEEQVVGDGHQWRVLDKRGTPVGMVRLPQAVSVQLADLTTVWGLETDSDGLQGIVRYRVAGR